MADIYLKALTAANGIDPRWSSQVQLIIYPRLYDLGHEDQLVLVAYV